MPQKVLEMLKFVKKTRSNVHICMLSFSEIERPSNFTISSSYSSFYVGIICVLFPGSVSHSNVLCILKYLLCLLLDKEMYLVLYKNSKKKYLKSKWKQDFGGHFTKMAHITYLSKCECLYSFPIACLNETMINEVTVGCCFCVYCTQYNFVLDIINQGLYNYANHVFELFTVG